MSTLASNLEWRYQIYQDSIPLIFTGQATNGGNGLRHPHRSEILAEAFLALAHGYKGINYYMYGTSASGDSGLVDRYYRHPEGTILDEKWDAVHDIFAQLDSIGDTLLLLDREAAYCATTPDYQTPVTGIHYEEEQGDTIEVGQFRLSSDPNQKYLILVNRKTNADRHITVETSLSGTNALRDLYSQERFVSSTGNFYSIPFDSGEGRVFKLEPEKSPDMAAEGY